jgi:predicted nucleic acid-binding protein
LGTIEVPILDTNVFTQIAKGNVQAAEALKRMLRTSNVRVCVARAAHDELVLRSPTQQLRDGYRAIIEDLEIAVAERSSMADRVDFHQQNIEYAPGPNELGRVTEYGKGAAKGKPGDAFVAAEARALNTELWTLDQPFARRAANQGVRIARESSIPYVAGVENIGMARRLLGLRPRLNLKLPNLASIKIKLANIKLGIRGALRVQVLRGFGVALLETAIFAIIGALLDGWRNRKWIREGLDLVDEYIQGKMPELAPEIAKLQLRLDEGEKVYLNYHIEIHYDCPRHKFPAYPDKYRDLQMTQGYSPGPSVWLADFTGLQISTQNKESHKTEKFGLFGAAGRIDHFIRSTEVAVFPKQDLDTFHELTGEYLSYKRKLGMDPYNQVWNEEANALRQQLVEAFGEDLWFLELENAD